MKVDPAQDISFVDETENALRTLRSLILVHRQAECPADTLAHAAEIRRLRKMAEEAGHGAAVPVLASLEDALTLYSSSAHVQNDSSTLALLDLITHAEAEIVKIFIADNEPFFDPSDLDGLSFDSVFPAASAPKESTAAEPCGDEDVYEADDEMLEIFSQEAEDLLTRIEACLETLAAHPEDKDAVWELRRHAHTFKGAAGIIGLKEPSRLAHRVEDVLDDLGNRGIVPDTRVLGLITLAAGHLRLLTDPGQAAPGPERAETLNNAFDEILEGITVRTEPEPSTAAPPVGPVVQKPETVPQDEPRRPIVRVAINRLDDLVLTVRDLVVGRSIVEQRLTEYSDLLESLGSITRRLQAATGKIEIDHEAALLENRSPVRFDRTFTSASDFGNHPTDGFDALELDRYTDFHESSRQLSEAVRELFTISTSLDTLRSGFDSVLSDQYRLIDEAQTKVAQIRLIRFDSISTRLQRAVRVACEEDDKKAEIIIENPETELDTDVLDAVVEPLTHLIRNAVAHGIEAPETRRLIGKPETGTISVGISDQETYIELTVRDDGHGIDESSLRRRAAEQGLITAGDEPSGHSAARGLLDLMCLPGLTTAEKLSMRAGRGVGMSIVKQSVESRRGSISVETAMQRGTTFTVRLPIAFTVTRALVVRAGGNFVAIPAKAISQIIDAADADISRPGGLEMLAIGGLELPIHDLRAYFAPAADPPPNEAPVVLLLECRGERLAMKVDEVLNISKLAVKPVVSPLDKLKGLLGVAVSGSGSVIPVLDLQYYSKLMPGPWADLTPGPPAAKPTALVVDDSASVRQMTSRMVLAAGWNVVTANDGIEALEILKADPEIRILFTDIEMPRMDGYELTEMLRQDHELSRIPVVFITSRGSEKHREMAARLGVTEYLTKPFFEADLVAVVGRISAKQEMQVI